MSIMTTPAGSAREMWIKKATEKFSDKISLMAMLKNIGVSSARTRILLEVPNQVKADMQRKPKYPKKRKYQFYYVDILSTFVMIDYPMVYYVILSLNPISAILSRDCLEIKIFDEHFKVRFVDPSYTVEYFESIETIWQTIKPKIRVMAAFLENSTIHMNVLYDLKTHWRHKSALSSYCKLAVNLSGYDRGRIIVKAQQLFMTHSTIMDYIQKTLLLIENLNRIGAIVSTYLLPGEDSGSPDANDDENLVAKNVKTNVFTASLNKFIDVVGVYVDDQPIQTASDKDKTTREAIQLMVDAANKLNKNEATLDLLRQENIVIKNMLYDPVKARPITDLTDIKRIESFISLFCELPKYQYETTLQMAERLCRGFIEDPAKQ